MNLNVSYCSLVAGCFGFPSHLLVGINDLQKDAFYITVTRSPTSEHQPGVLSVRKLRLRWALMTQSRDVPLKDTDPKINHGELRRILSRIKFIDLAQKVRFLGF